LEPANSRPDSAPVFGASAKLASCLYLQRELGQTVPFVAFDEGLTDAASDEGLTVVSSFPRRR